MGHAARPRRSVLYMPGSNARALEKAKTLPADALILDLEDAVAPDLKETARGQVVEAAGSNAYGRREVAIRANGLETSWGPDDIAAAAGSGSDAILLPKVESAAMVKQAEAIMSANGAPDDQAIWCMMETPRGILHAEEIAGASPRIACLVMGTSDLTMDLHASHTALRLPMVTSLGLCLLAARAAGIGIVDGVHLDLEDDDGLEAACRQGLEFGFDGKTLIHPKQIAAANRTFAPGQHEIAEAYAIITAFEDAQKAGKGVVVVDGQLIENLHVEGAQRLIALADAIAELEAASA